MSDKVLTDDEKAALLNGVSSGAVEVHSAGGPAYASVKPFVIGARARIVSDGLPRLAAINEQLAERLAAATESLLQSSAGVTPKAIRQCDWGDYGDPLSPRAAVVAFTAAPFDGKAVLVIDATLLSPLLDAFFGGHADDDAGDGDARLSPGAMNMARLYARQILAALKDAFAPVRELAPELAGATAGLDLADIIDDGDLVVGSAFEVGLGGVAGAFHVVWPATMVAPVLPALAGRRAERDAAEEARWATVLKKRLPDVTLSLDSDVGHATMTLGTLINLNPGDVIAIDSPRLATVAARGVPLIRGRFGVQSGRNAVETMNWLDPEIDN